MLQSLATFWKQKNMQKRIGSGKFSYGFILEIYILATFYNYNIKSDLALITENNNSEVINLKLDSHS